MKDPYKPVVDREFEPKKQTINMKIYGNYVNGTYEMNSDIGWIDSES